MRAQVALTPTLLGDREPKAPTEDGQEQQARSVRRRRVVA